jgi:hypothetical protein
MVAYDGIAHGGGERAEMEEAVAAVATGAVTTASRDVAAGRLSVDRARSSARSRGAGRRRRRFDEVAAAVVERLLAEPRAC